MNQISACKVLKRDWKRENNVEQARKHLLQKKYRRHVLFHGKMNLTCQPIKFKENAWM